MQQFATLANKLRDTERERESEIQNLTFSKISIQKPKTTKISSNKRILTLNTQQQQQLKNFFTKNEKSN